MLLIVNTIRRLQNEQEVARVFMNYDINDNTGRQNINNLVNDHLIRLTRNLNYISDTILEYITDSRVLNNLRNDELMRLTILLNNYKTSLETEINRIGNDLEAMGRDDINKRALRLRRRAIITIKKNRKEIKRRGLVY